MHDKVIVNCIRSIHTNQRKSNLIPIISFDGLPGSGKSTQIRLIQDVLKRRGVETSIIELPGQNPFGTILSSVYDNHLHKSLCDVDPFINIFTLSCDAQMEIEKAYENQSTLGLMARGILTTYYFNIPFYLNHFGSSADQKLWNHLSAFPMPDIIYYLELDPLHARQRLVDRTERSLRNRDALENLQRDEIELKQLSVKFSEFTKIVYIDANQSQEQISNIVIEDLVKKGYLKISHSKGEDK